MPVEPKRKNKPMDTNEGGIGGIKPPYAGYAPRSNDPSVLTTDLVLREVASLKELLQARLAGVEKGIEVAHDDLVRVPTETQKAVGSLQALMEEKIAHDREVNDVKIAYEIRIKNLLNDVINKNFERVEAHRLEYKADSTRAIESALNAQKELNRQTTENIILVVSKNEAMFTKLIDSMANTMNLGFNNLRESISELKTFQSKNIGSKEGVKDFRDWFPWLIAIISFLILLYSLNNK